MNVNPFDILKNAQKIQEGMSELQGKLGAIVVVGSAGGGMAQVRMNGRMEVLSVEIADEAIDPAEKTLLQDLIKAAFTDASERAKEAIKNEMGALTGGMGLPPGFGPF